MEQWRHQVAVEPSENSIAFAQLAEHPGLGFKDRSLAEAEEDASDDAGSRLYKYARHCDDQHDHKMSLPRMLSGHLMYDLQNDSKGDISGGETSPCCCICE